MEKEEKKGYICCSVDDANHGFKTIQMCVVENIDKVHEFMEVNIKGIKDTVDEKIKNGELSVEEEIIEDTNYYLFLKNKKKDMFSADGCYFQLESFEFIYNVPFKFQTF